MKTGRSSKFTPETCAIILEKIENGNFLSTAARYAGVDYSNFKRWMERGKSKAPEDAGFRAFRAAVRRARAKAEAEAVERITRAKTESADKWFLERSFSQRWAPKSQVKMDANVKNPDAERERVDLNTVLAALRHRAGTEATPVGDREG